VDKIKKITIWLIIILIVCICLLLGQCGETSKYKDAYNKAESLRAAAQTRATELLGRLESSTTELERANNLVQFLSAKIDGLIEDDKRIKEYYKELAGFLESSETTIDRSNKAIAGLEETIAELEKYCEQQSKK
jgi:chromosome segregation ATPase